MLYTNGSCNQPEHVQGTKVWSFVYAAAKSMVPHALLLLTSKLQIMMVNNTQRYQFSQVLCNCMIKVFCESKTGIMAVISC